MTYRTFAELKRLAREFLNGNYITLIPSVLITVMTPAVLLSIFSADFPAALTPAAVSYGIAAFIIKLIGQLFHIALIRIHLQLAKKQPITLTDIFWTFRSCPDRFLLAQLLLSALLLLPFLPAAACIYYALNIKSKLNYILIGFIILVFCAMELYLLNMYGLIYPLYIENPEMTLRSCFRTSRILMQGKKWKLFLLKLSFIGWYLLGFCSLGIGLLWIYPYSAQTTANFYLDITNSSFDKDTEQTN